MKTFRTIIIIIVLLFHVKWLFVDTGDLVYVCTLLVEYGTCILAEMDAYIVWAVLDIFCHILGYILEAAAVVVVVDQDIFCRILGYMVEVEAVVVENHISCRNMVVVEYRIPCRNMVVVENHISCRDMVVVVVENHISCRNMVAMVVAE